MSDCKPFASSACNLHKLFTANYIRFLHANLHDLVVCGISTLSKHVMLCGASQPVPRGTNGGVSVLGTAAAAAGGTLIGLVFVVAGLFSTTNCQGHVWQSQWLALPLGTLCGLLGSVLDSFLGATAQFSGMCKVRKKVTTTPSQPLVFHAKLHTPI